MIGTEGAQWQSWTAERTAYLGLVLGKMLRGSTEAAVSITSSLVTVVSRFALQVGRSPFLIYWSVWILGSRQLSNLTCVLLSQQGCRLKADSCMFFVSLEHAWQCI